MKQTVNTGGNPTPGAAEGPISPILESGASFARRASTELAKVASEVASSLTNLSHHDNAIISPSHDESKPAPGMPEHYFPKNNESHGWTDADTDFKVRGPTYLTDKEKVTSESPSAAELLDVDVFRYTDKLRDYSSYPDSYCQRLKTTGDKRFLFIVHFYTNPEHLVITFALRPEVLESDAGFRTAWTRFVEGDDSYRSTRLKILVRIIEASWFVRKAVGENPKPAILGTKMDVKYFKGEGYIEALCDCTSSMVAASLLGVCKGASKSLILDLGFMIEGQQDDELPERVLGIQRIVKVDMGKFRKLDD